MGLVHDAHDVVYLKALKPGGTSAEAALEPLCAPPGHAVRHSPPETVNQHGVIGARAPMKPQEADSYSTDPHATCRLGVNHMTPDAPPVSVRSRTAVFTTNLARRAVQPEHQQQPRT